MIVNIEKDAIDLQQYIRRNNIETCGYVKDEDLQEKVIKIAHSLDVNIDNFDIEACNRLKEKNPKKGQPKRAIVRCVNRKVCDNPS